MARRSPTTRADRRRRRSWFLLFVGVVLIVTTGFVAGLVAGVVSEEPALLAGHLAGRSEAIDWTEAPPPVAAGPPHDAGYSVQAALYPHSDAARNAAEGLRRKGYSAEVVPSPGEREQRWQVWVGPMASRDEARRVARRLEEDERLSPRVVALSGS